jgi:LemA protein
MVSTGIFITIAAVAALLGVVVLAWAVGLYNGLVQLRERCETAWKNIDVLLRQRHDELPKLVELCKGFMAHEQSVLESVTQLRSRFDGAGSVDAKVGAENLLNIALLGLYARVEAYPDLKGSERMLDLQKRISELEGSISHRREFFNDSVGLYNIYIRRFPQLLIASRLGFRPRAYLEDPVPRGAGPSMTGLSGGR